VIPDPLERAWAGGLFEGEGCFSLSRGLHPNAQLRMTDEDSVRRFAAAVGVGRITGPYSQKGHKLTWAWTVHSFENVQYIGALLWPYLGARRRRRFAEVLAPTKNGERPSDEQRAYDKEVRRRLRERRRAA